MITICHDIVNERITDKANVSRSLTLQHGCRLEDKVVEESYTICLSADSGRRWNVHDEQIQESGQRENTQDLLELGEWTKMK